MRNTNQEVAQSSPKKSIQGNVPMSPIDDVLVRLQDAVTRNQENTSKLQMRLLPVMDNSPRSEVTEDNMKRDTDTTNLVSIIHEIADLINLVNNQQNDILDRLQV